MTGPYAKIIADSVSPEGVRLTTMEVRMHRFVLAEFNTHRVFSRNSASSRAIPVEKQVERIHTDPAIPVSWPEEKAGMQGGDDLPLDDQWQCIGEWQQAASNAFRSVHALRHLGGLEGRKLHKSVVNRLLEPFMWHTVVVTSTAWENFFEQRCSPLAQPEIRLVAVMMQDVYGVSYPTPLKEGQWHTPYVDNSEVESEWTAVKVSAARCARVSYLTQDGKRDIEADEKLYQRLVTANPPHWSPLEHVATPWGANVQINPLRFEGVMSGRQHTVDTTHLPRVGNLVGWRSLRTEVEATQRVRTYE